MGLRFIFEIYCFNFFGHFFLIVYFYSWLTIWWYRLWYDIRTALCFGIIILLIGTNNNDTNHNHGYHCLFISWSSKTRVIHLKTTTNLGTPQSIPSHSCTVWYGMIQYSTAALARLKWPETCRTNRALIGRSWAVANCWAGHVESIVSYGGTSLLYTTLHSYSVLGICMICMKYSICMRPGSR